MRKIQQILIVLTVLALCGSLFFDTRTLTYLSFILIFTIGIVHGANDIQIIKKAQSKESSVVKLLGIYVLTVLGVGVVFFTLPKLALLVFVIISGYHFGEQHFHDLNIRFRIVKYLFFSSYGLTILFTLLYFNAELSSEIIEQISGVSVSEEQLFTVSGISLITLIISGAIIRVQGGLNQWPKELIYFLFIGILFKYSPLIWGFAVYFVIWHSLPSLLDQVRFLSGTVTKRSIWEYVKSSLLYWIMSIVGLVVFAYFFKDDDDLFLTLFFTFLAAITFPHVIVMHQLFDDHNK